MRRKKSSPVKWEVLEKWPEYLRQVKPSMFDIGKFRLIHDYYSPQCNSVGCVLGHMVQYATCEIPRYPRKHEDFEKGEINFYQFSKTELNIGYEDALWDFLFGHMWTKETRLKERNFAAKRIEAALKHRHLGSNDPEWYDIAEKFAKQIEQ